MPYLKLPDGTEIGVTLEDLTNSIKLLFTGSTPHINYNLGFITRFYAKEPTWLTAHTTRGDVVAPYVILFDYRDQAPDQAWGHVTVGSAYDFPKELLSHREAMVANFNREGKLSRGNRPCPRVLSFERGTDGLPVLTVHRAFYYDQVGTNLTPDEPLQPALKQGDITCASVRTWDLAQASCEERLPAFSASRLANTIGVAVGITVPDKYGRPQVLRRKRTKKVAVYEGQWHVPFSFALAWTETLRAGDSLNLAGLILPDYGHEFAEELRGFEITDFEPARPLAFCRDMVRAGKPQFFFEIRSRILIEDLKKRIGPDDLEYRGKVEVADGQAVEMSPELLAFSLLVSRGDLDAS